jgi:hypothetical protein
MVLADAAPFSLLKIVLLMKAGRNSLPVRRHGAQYPPTFVT